MKTKMINPINLRVELARNKKSHAWLAKKLQFKSRQAFFYQLRRGKIDDRIIEISELLNCSKSDLIRG